MFLGNMFGSSIQAALSMQASNTLDNARKSSTKNTGDGVQHIEQVFYESLGRNIVKKGPSSMLPLDRKKIASMFGKDVAVQLPGGQPFNTKLIGTKENQHDINNRFAEHVDAAASTRFPPGMKSNLEIDYGKPHSKEFEKVSTSPSFSTSSKKIQDISLLISLLILMIVMTKTGVKKKKHEFTCPEKRAWDRLFSKNSDMLLLDKKEVTPEEYQIRKKARKTTKHLIKHKKIPNPSSL